MFKPCSILINLNCLGTMLPAVYEFEPSALRLFIVNLAPSTPHASSGVHLPLPNALQVLFTQGEVRLSWAAAVLSHDAMIGRNMHVLTIEGSSPNGTVWASSSSPSPPSEFPKC